MSSLFSVLIAAALAMAPKQPIGTVSARGSFLVDGFQTWRHGSVFDGTRLRASRVVVHVWTRDGSRWELAAASEGTIRSGLFVLAEGVVRATAPAGVEIDGTVVRCAGCQIEKHKGSPLAVLYTGARPALSGPVSIQVQHVDRLPDLSSDPEEQRPLSQRP